MAKRKSNKKRTSRRRRSGVGAINAGNMVTSIGGVLAGVAAASLLNKMVLSGKSNVIQTGVPIALGIAVPAFLLKSEIGKMVGAGMLAYGGSKLLTQFGIGALGQDENFLPVMISGDDITTIAGTGEDFAMAGDYAMAGDDITTLAGQYDNDLSDD